LKDREIGKSLFGTVRYAWDVVTNQWVVIKQSDIEKASEKVSTRGVRVAEDLNMEIELLRRLSEDENPCPFLVRLLDVCQDATYIYVVLEYIECGDLFSYVQSNIAEILNMRDPRMKKQHLQRYQKNIRKWIKQILLCLKFMHDRNICHRDVSLENTMLSKDSNAKLIDLGVAHYYPDGNFSTEHGCIGKIQYCSPECLQNEYYDGRANDIWCVGVMLWMSLIGAPPWDSADKSDARFVFIMGGISGVLGLLTRWRRRWMCPDSAADLLSKIFRSQKDRIRMEQILSHPFLTGRNEHVVGNYIKSRKLPVSRGYSVDEEKIGEPGWFIKLKEIKRWNLLQTFKDWKQRGGLQTPRSKEKFLEDLEWKFGLNRVQCDEFRKYLEESGKLRNQSVEDSSQYPEQLRMVILRELKTKFKLSDTICQEICAYFSTRKKLEKQPAGGAQDIS